MQLQNGLGPAAEGQRQNGPAEDKRPRRRRESDLRLMKIVFTRARLSQTVLGPVLTGLFE